ncbi:MAG: hypothetical protein ACETWQ_01560 [Phycisphaerae bacterium]
MGTADHPKRNVTWNIDLQAFADQGVNLANVNNGQGAHREDCG